MCLFRASLQRNSDSKRRENDRERWVKEKGEERERKGGGK